MNPSVDQHADLAARVDRLEADLIARLATIDARLDALLTVRTLPQPQPPTPALSVTTRPPGLGAAVVARPQGPPPSPPPPPPSVDAVALPPPPIADSFRSGGPQASAVPRPPRRSARTGPQPIELTAEVLLRWAGVGLVVLAALFLVSTAVSEGWVGPELQLLGGALIGVSLFAGSIKLASSRRSWSTALASGGAAVLIVCAGATSAWLGLVPLTVALAVVSAAMAGSLVIAIRQDMATVGGTVFAAAFAAATWMAVWSDASFGLVAGWLLVMAVTALLIGRRYGWTVIRLAVTWAVALAVLVLAPLRIDALSTTEVVLGVILAIVVAAMLWAAPLIDRGASSGVSLRGAASVLAIDHRAVASIPLWLWWTGGLYAGIDDDRIAGFLGVGVAAAFTVAIVAAAVVRVVSGPLAWSHVLGVAVVLSASSVVALGGPLLPVALAVQAVAGLLVARWFAGDLVLRIQAILLAGSAFLLLVEGLFAAAANESIDTGTTGAHLVVVVALAIVAWLVETDGRDFSLGPNRSGAGNRAGSERSVTQPLTVGLSDLVTGMAWVAGLGFITSLVAPFVADSGALALLTVLSLTSLAMGRLLGPSVSAVGVAGLVAAGIAGAVKMFVALVALVALVDNVTPIDHLATLSVVAAYGAVSVALWCGQPRSLVPARATQIGRSLFVVFWLGTLGWFASVFVFLPQGQAAISVVWAIMSCGAIVFGVRTENWLTRSLGLGTLVVVVGKLLTIDLAEVDVLWRVGLFLGIGVGLLRLGYLLPELYSKSLSAQQTTSDDADPETDEHRGTSMTRPEGCG